MAESARLVEVADHEAAQLLFLRRGLSDGLPLTPPTPDLVDATITSGGRARDAVLGVIQGRANGINVEQAAVCAVMAGAAPSHFPVILATWDAIFDPAFNAVAVLGSSGGTAITAVVSGPYAEAIGMNAGHNVFGPGNRANVTIGRAVRLGVMNALGYRPGGLDGSAFGNQARFFAHFAERQPPEGWTQLNVRLGYAKNTTTVTVAVTDAPRQVTHIRTGDAENVLRMFAAAMRDPSHCAAGRESMYFIVVGPEHAEILAGAGLSPRDVRAELAQRSRITPEELSLGGMPMGPDRIPIGEQGRVTIGADGKLANANPDEVFVVTAGGTGAGWSAVIYGYAPSAVFKPVTKQVILP
jgi:hypothetical protein